MANKQQAQRVTFLSHLRSFGMNPENMGGATIKRYRLRMKSAKQDSTTGVWTVLNSEADPRNTKKKSKT